MDMGLKIGLICLILLPIMPLLFLFLEDFKDAIDSLSLSSTYNYITFDRFVAFYNINPDRWELYDGYVQYAVPQIYKFSNGVEHTYVDKYISFHFNFKDRIKYKRWKSNRHKLKKQQEHFKEYQEVLECVKKDLEQFTRENDEMMKRETEKYQKQVEDILFM